MATPLGTLGLGLVVCLFMLCIVGFFSFCYKWLNTLACIFTSCHAWYIGYGYRFYCILSCITFIIIFLRAHTLNFKLGRELAACLMT